MFFNCIVDDGDADHVLYFLLNDFIPSVRGVASPVGHRGDFLWLTIFLHQNKGNFLFISGHFERSKIIMSWL